MKYTHTALLGLGLASFCLQPALAQDKTYQLQNKYTAGEVLKYAFQMQMDMKFNASTGKETPPLPNQNMRMSMVRTQKTNKVYPNGSADIETEVLQSSMNVAGKSQAIPHAGKTSMHIDRWGGASSLKLPSSVTSNPLSGMFNFDQLASQGLNLPKHPVKVGDTWGQSFPLGKQSVTLTNTLVGATSQNGYEVLTIQQELSFPMDALMSAFAGGAMPGGMGFKGGMDMQSIILLRSDTGQRLQTNAKFDADITIELGEEAAKQSPFGDKFQMSMHGIIADRLLSVGRSTAQPSKSVPHSKK